MTWQLAADVATAWIALAMVGLTFFQGVKRVNAAPSRARRAHGHVRRNGSAHLRLVS